jgi:hypothetical protein
METPSTSSIWKLAGISFLNFLNLGIHDRLHLRKDRLKGSFILGGKAYKIFRETVNVSPDSEIPVILVIGFRLKMIKSNKVMHWLFQRICILTTPFWSGIKGFYIKLWMVDPVTGSYAGIYEWRGEENGRKYVAALLAVLKPLSTQGSVWSKIIPNKNLDEYLESVNVS